VSRHDSFWWKVVHKEADEDEERVFINAVHQRNCTLVNHGNREFYDLFNMEIGKRITNGSS
jgi:hypothetical protein